jgi:hypothetical protein
MHTVAVAVVQCSNDQSDRLLRVMQMNSLHERSMVGYGTVYTVQFAMLDEWSGGEANHSVPFIQHASHSSTTHPQSSTVIRYIYCINEENTRYIINIVSAPPTATSPSYYHFIIIIRRHIIKGLSPLLSSPNKQAALAHQLCVE